MEKRPLVSVILCTYNGEKFIAQQVDSILRQTYSPIELIISDDASADQTSRILEKYKADSRITFFRRDQNIGLSANFSFAASQAKGELIAFSDQDDIWLENKIEKLVAHTGDSPLVYSNSILTDETGNPTGKKLTDLRAMYSGNDSRCYILYSCVWGHSMLITRNLLMHSLPIPATIHHDIWIAYRAFIEGGILYHDEVLTLYRQHSSSYTGALSKSKATRKRAERYQAYQKQLHWIQLMQQNERSQYQPFYTRLAALYGEKEKGKYVFGLLFFMLRHREILFRLSGKSLLSNIIEIIKQARGEKSVRSA
jgi:glycosyltransferase involved in cell wall biosynthesis